MTVVTIRPDSTDASSTGTVTGAASAHLATSDNNDGSYVSFLRQSARFTFGDLTFPAGVLFKSVQVRMRCARTGGTVPFEVRAWPGDPTALGSTDYWSTRWDIAWTAQTTVSAPRWTNAIAPEKPPWTNNSINALRLDTLSQLGLFSPDGTAHVYELYFDVTYVSKPVTSVTAPSGTVSDTNRPTVQWSNTLDDDGDGDGGQAYYDVKVFSQAQYTAGGFNPATSAAADASGVVLSSATSRQVAGILPDGTYRAYVRVAQTVNGAQHWSDWAFSGFTISVALPAVPQLTPTPQPARGHVSVNVIGNTGAATTDAVDLERSTDGGTTWTPVRTQYGDDGRVLLSAVTVNDYEAPNGPDFLYRARALHNYSGQWAASAWTQSTTAWVSSQWWLKHPNRPALNVPVELFSYSKVTRAARMAAIQPLGASLPVVMSDVRAGATGEITIQARTTTEQDALNTILDTVDTLLLQGPVADGHPDRYVRFADQDGERVVDKAFSHITRETLPWHLVERPSGAQAVPQYTAPAEAPEELIIA